MEGEASGEPLFRASKRRKILRKRTGSDASNHSPVAVSNDAEALITKQSSDNDESIVTGVVRSQRKGGIRKHGIGFTSGDASRNAEVQNEGQALVLADEDEAQGGMQSDRFVKPTGRVAVADDKHMTAYIDSKLAEMRSSAGTTMNGTDTQDATSLAGVKQDQDSAFQHGMQSQFGTLSASDLRTLQQAQARSTRVYQRPTKRRQPPQRDQADVARDSLIDQIMRESEIPLYDRSISQTPRTNDDELDNDAATAEAFKAQLIAEMEEHRRRPPPSSTASKDKPASNGPKLGGSRSQREKMRAMEEAKANAGKK